MVNTNLPRLDVVDTANASAADAQQPKAIWHAPTLTRIDIKQTLSEVGSPIDGFVTGSL